MTGGIVLLLHRAAEAEYAGNMARALSSQCNAVAIPIGDRTLKIGMGATCVVICPRGMSEPGAGDAVLASLPRAGQNALLCVFEGAVVPDALQYLPRVRVQGFGFAVSDAKSVAKALSDRRERSSVVGTATPHPALRSPALDAKPSRPGNFGKGQFVARSALGLVATMAVVGVAAPFIGARAGTTDVVPDQNRSSSDLLVGGSATAVAAELDDSSSAPEPRNATEQPSYEQLSMASQRDSVEAIAPPVGMVITTGLTDNQQVDLGMTSDMEVLNDVAITSDDPALDLKTAEVIAAMVAGAAVSDWKIDADPAPRSHDQKPQSMSEESKPETRAHIT
ncbi:MAG: hypothetical protein KF779_02640 [Hyphomonadaceae bacterium]|nr:hypothetical protein [Hyphomonadaceae bacterium]